MRVLILLIYLHCHPNSFPTDVFLFKWIRSFQHSQDHPSVFFQHCSSPSCLCFSRPPTLFLKGLGFLNQVSILLMGRLSILFRQCFYPVILMKMLRKLQAHNSSFFSSPVYSIQALLIISFPRFKCFLMPMQLLIIHFSLFICSGVLKISQKARVFMQDPFNLLRGCYLIQAI